MKQIITTLLLLIVITVRSQVFTNSNSELCVKLYTVNDAAGEYMVYLVIEEDLSTEDVALLKVWDTLPQQKKSSLTQRWSTQGRRVEVIRPPYHMYPPVFPGDLKQPVLYKRKVQTMDYCPWTDSTLYNFHGNYKLIKY